MIRKTVRVEKHNTRTAIFFVIFVCGIIFISIVVKTLSVLAQSKFDGANRFAISVANNKNLEVVSFSPKKQSISVLKLEGETKNLNLGRFLKTPFDGFILGSTVPIGNDVANLMSNVLFNYKNVKTNLTIIDILRLFLASKSTKANNILTLNISSSLEDQSVDKIVAKLFKDEEIEKENKSVEIINASLVSGLGGRLARLITNMGGNVIQVSTENNLRKESVILYSGKKSFTAERFSKVLGIRASETDKQSIADITIVIGEDNKDPKSF